MLRKFHDPETGASRLSLIASTLRKPQNLQTRFLCVALPRLRCHDDLDLVVDASLDEYVAQRAVLGYRFRIQHRFIVTETDKATGLQNPEIRPLFRLGRDNLHVSDRRG